MARQNTLPPHKMSRLNGGVWLGEGEPPGEPALECVAGTLVPVGEADRTVDSGRGLGRASLPPGLLFDTALAVQNDPCPGPGRIVY